jgi:hypothetical protein
VSNSLNEEDGFLSKASDVVGFFWKKCDPQCPTTGRKLIKNGTISTADGAIFLLF